MAEYSQEEYENKKAIINDNYQFLDQPIEHYRDKNIDKYKIPDNHFSMNTYEFRVIADLEYPKDFGIIAASDKYKKIVYLYFYDFDLDYIEDMFHFVEEEFNYTW